MSTEHANDAHIKDEEGNVDRQTKQQLMQLRKQVDEDERRLYVEMRSDPEYALTVEKCNEFWGVSVRQFLRSIKRLWTGKESSEVRNASHYWKEHEIGAVELMPPNKQNFAFADVAQMQATTKRKRRLLGLPRGVEVPKPQQKRFHGLMSVLDQTRVSHTWNVCLDNRGPPPEHTNITLQESMPVPKHILENAVEAADVFLQDVGIGFEIGAPDYFGGDEPGI